MLIVVDSVEASDSWGFVGVVKVGDVEAFRTLASFHTPDDASNAARELVASVLGELLAGAEWRQIRESAGGRPPTRKDYQLETLKHRSSDAQPLEEGRHATED